jgi:ABC-type transport system involved in multi-copper enzyme maturation permease subunit
MDTTLIFTGLIFGSIGMGYILYGRKQLNMMALVSGVALCVFPYFISSVWITIAVGMGLVLMPFLIRL